MARKINRLTARAVANLTTAGLHTDGNGLYLRISSGKVAGKRWVFIYDVRGRRREMGLGSASTVSLAQAREKAREARAMLDAGTNPLGQTEQEKRRVPTFGELAAEHIETMSPQWRNAKHRQQWRNTLVTYAKPIADKHVDEIDTTDVLAVLKPIWQAKPETASRVRGRIETILDVAKVRDWRDGQNPAQWRGHLALLLPARTQESRTHHDAMAIDALPAFIATLRERQAVAPRCLELPILTAARTSEATDAQWDEFDLNAAVWTVPAARMKAKRAHRVPLVTRALDILGEMDAIRDGEFVFPGLRRGKPLSNMSMLMLLRRMGVEDATTHGMSSGFRDFVSDHTSFQPDLAEMALAHTLPSKTERAYRRGDALERRRPMMTAWADFLHGAHD